MRTRVVAAAALAAGSVMAQASAGDVVRPEVFAAERAFACSMAARDFAGFGRLVAEDTIIFSGRAVQRGRAVVLAAWKAFFDGRTAPLFPGARPLSSRTK